MPTSGVSSDQKLLHDKRIAAEMLSVSRRSIDNLIRDKRLSAVHIGRRCLIRHADLLKFIKRGTK
jgi:excisionase family DNA binding protein